MKQEVRMAIYLQFCEKTSVLFCTDVAARGLDFPAVNWVVQVSSGYCASVMGELLIHFVRLYRLIAQMVFQTIFTVLVALRVLLLKESQFYFLIPQKEKCSLIYKAQRLKYLYN